ncbi:Asp-tRNA(Asn)/Glu-tRNA(Gln) amidotransferase GatCAB subunit C [Candidatus Collierbacteria bacterium CG10_big_fil_rev_8_21_14_0_10_44_9]|uniref:Aspartyl/glutamyl-tRNA(Asn/Gln) amidotransferase subunit C n=1 Tax=Candidatus Collierbacteria bacterium CG10_big_fil_rev_8_21_14_0_10_44_9 TaxID=1974535 RepID=A0A2H0VLU9_9BACT|nr:MAG: Asp-tRNA(Asn)/Glu-tRNA(Gln) amidotransferase GatCAB subunit C [Candidatus Collierbacteria bacterium CG10_big_fil_rev_8_21_14_0_10_44_9]
MTNNQITNQDVQHLAKLVSLPLTDDRLNKLVDQITTTFEYINTLQAIDTDSTQETNQVTGLENIMREDVVEESRMLSQNQALQNAKHTHNGYFLVPAILE